LRRHSAAPLRLAPAHAIADNPPSIDTLIEDGSMRSSRTVKTIAVVLMANLVALGFAPSTSAAVVGTERAIAGQDRDERIARINSVLARDSVRQQLEKLGVDPADAQARVAALSDAELVALDERMQELPAGAGALEVLGILLLVLLVLELVGVTDVFKSL
jgi:hypothetical protein